MFSGGTVSKVVQVLGAKKSSLLSGGGGREVVTRGDMDIHRFGTTVAIPADATENPRRFTETYTLTLGDQAENHVGMQKIGKLASCGFTLDDLSKAQEWFSSRGGDCELIDLSSTLPANKKSALTEDAFILIVRNALGVLSTGGDGLAISADGLFEEQRVLPKDTKARMYGRVVNKHARHNLCFADEAQEPDYANGKGRIIAFADVPMLAELRRVLPTIVGPKADNLAVEGNYYFSPEKCGIGYHGDSERMKVIGVRMGASLPLCFAWFQDNGLVSIESATTLTLHHGDLYIMSQKATGQDWKSKKKLTLRHAAGCKKYTKLPGSA